MDFAIAERNEVRILLVHNHYQQRGGEDAVVANEQALLERAGHTVDLFTAHNANISGWAAKMSALRGVTYNTYFRHLLAERLVDEAPDVAHVHNTFPLLSPSVYDACLEANVPVVQTLHNFRIFCAGALLLRDGKICELCLDGRPYRAVVHRCYRDSTIGSLAAANMIAYHRRHHTWSTKVTRYIALSEFARHKFIEAGLPPDRIAVKPNFVMDPCQPAPSSREGVLFVGRLSHEKGVSILIQALAGTGIPLRVLGDGPERAALEAQASTNVTFEGHVKATRVREAMRSANVLALPSLSYEGFPLSVLEAFASGLPVVASKLGSLTEIVEDHVTGRLVPPGEPDELRAAITDLFANRDQLKAMGLAARQRYEVSYSPDRNIEQLLGIYEAAISEAKAGQRDKSADLRFGVHGTGS